MRTKRTLLITLLATVCCGFYLIDYENKTTIKKLPTAPTYNTELASPEKFPWQRPRPKETFNFPITIGQIGPVEPLFARANEYPFYCRSEDSGLGPPMVDNHEGYGYPVYQRDENGKRGKLLGYSKDCSVPMHIRYYYRRKNTENFFPLEQANNDIDLIEVEGKLIPFIVRAEVGTINRYLYTIFHLKGPDDKPLQIDRSHLNNKLIYYFLGGVGIGKQQGKLKLSSTLRHLSEQIKQGYAVLYSTGNQTSVHFNIELAEDTALRVKRQYLAQYGEPLYTLGIGGSGGAIQQYLFAQNNPDLLDGIIPLYSYPDMMTQITYAFDCELLEYYFDVTDRENARWQVWENKSLVIGLSANSQIKNRYSDINRIASLAKLKWPSDEIGASECTNGWRGLTPYVNNPKLTRYREHFSDELTENLHFTIWDDLKKIVGVDSNGYAKVAWDNIGVQYGLEALKQNKITVQEFLKLNRHIGGWKSSEKLVQEKFWYFTGDYNPRNFDIYSAHNMLQSVDGVTPAMRSVGDVSAINALYRSGMIFFGKVKIPILDLRHYLEEDLDMHHLSASFSARARIELFEGAADHHVLWVTKKPHTPTTEAVNVMDAWLMNIVDSKHKDVVAAKPEEASDSCFSSEGQILHSGRGVWDGSWNNKPSGLCSKKYPSFSNSRIEAGDSWAGLGFKCQLQSIEQAIARGVYGDVNMLAYKDELELIFDDGVCDFSRAPLGFPLEVYGANRLLTYLDRTTPK